MTAFLLGFVVGVLVFFVLPRLLNAHERDRRAAGLPPRRKLRGRRGGG